MGGVAVVGIRVEEEEEEGKRGETRHSLTPPPQREEPLPDWAAVRRKKKKKSVTICQVNGLSGQVALGGPDDTLTYVELVNSFIIAGIRTPAFCQMKQTCRVLGGNLQFGQVDRGIAITRAPLITPPPPLHPSPTTTTCVSCCCGVQAA